MGIYIPRFSKEKLAWASDKWLWLIIVTSLGNYRKGCIKLKKILMHCYAVFSNVIILYSIYSK